MISSVINFPGNRRPGGVRPTDMTLRRFAVLIAATAALALSACANGTSSSPPAPADPSATGEQSVPSAPVSSLPTSRLPVEKGSTTLSGTVAAGVEPGCLILSNHVLIFDDPALRAQAPAGATVSVTGRADATRMSTCQQGVPFIVTAVRTS